MINILKKINLTKLLINMKLKKTIIVDEQKLNIVFGKTKQEWKRDVESQCDEGDLWDFPIEEMLDGSVEINESIYYWLIDGRLYETFDYAL